MDGKLRRESILNDLKASSEAITGAEFSKRYKVSRQVIVQDIALIRAQGTQIISTSEGYLIYKIKKNTVKRVIHVKHFGQDIQDELTTIVDNGGTIIDVIVMHPVYGEIATSMMLSSRLGVNKFMDKLAKNDFVPLLNLTHGEHFHTIEGKDEVVIKEIEKALKQKGYLLTSE